MLIGYARTSTLEQVAGVDAQIKQLSEYGCDRIFREQVSSVASRTELESAIDHLRPDDKLVVCKLDRLARNVTHMGKLLEEIETKVSQLQAMHRTLSHLVACCDGDSRPTCPIIDTLAGDRQP